MLSQRKTNYLKVRKNQESKQLVFNIIFCSHIIDTLGFCYFLSNGDKIINYDYLHLSKSDEFSVSFTNSNFKSFRSSRRTFMIKSFCSTSKYVFVYKTNMFTLDIDKKSICTSRRLLDSCIKDILE